MAYTVEQALEVSGLTQTQKDYLANTQKANERLKRETTFEADTPAKLKTELSKRIAANQKQKESTQKRNEDYAECLTIVRRMVGRIKGEKSIIRVAELKEKLLALEDSIKNEKQYQKVADAIAKSGMTKEQIIEYVQSKM